MRLVKMALSNAENNLVNSIATSKEAFLETIKSVLKLQKIPHSIEGIDISNLRGGLAVGSIVSFLNTDPRKSGYRNYKIKHVDNIDDYGMMTEVISRRIQKGDIPDLFVVDGGKGHLMAVKKVIDTIGYDSRPDVIAIAKGHNGDPVKQDKIYVPNRKNPLPLRNNDPVLLLIMRIRDEAHRRAVGYHRYLRAKNMKESVLDLIPGVGPGIKKLLLQKFGDIHNISKTKPEELAKTPGIGSIIAQNISNYFEHNMKNIGDS